MSNKVDQIRAILSRELNIGVGGLSSAARLREDLKMDSIIALNLMFAAEKELNITLKEEDVVDLVTVGDLETLIARLSGH